MAQVSVTIDDKTYRMACDEGQEEHLLGLAEQLDGYIRHLKGSFGEIGDHRLSVMAGIMVMDELSDTKERLGKLEAEIASLKNERDSAEKKAHAAGGAIAGDISRLAERVQAIAKKLDG
ncbi:cell division protein ZapA [Notoacmeibacter ruber]|uniref:Cell division protein ZapA n=1 Tax=Notoacmeibacter ruber TaxID=2670375 RepID=A0A3L7JE48_9HYPH|nr:cell division protein ZapA [Notoacmeibacter ruber]RLQ88734.1 cell division protein ZapA [Notoacmeibacter ruber]